jgi:hypothetical protein
MTTSSITISELRIATRIPNRALRQTPYDIDETIKVVGLGYKLSAEW